MNKVKDKTEEVEKYIQELFKIIPNNFKEYKINFKTKAACERYFERIIESIVDLAFLIIKENKFQTPEEDKQAFDILKNENVISEILATKLKDAKGMRNIIAHEYGKIDDELVFESITKELMKDTNEFINLIKKLKF